MSLVIKRLIDLAASCAGLLVLWPIIALSILYVRFETPGPGIFAQKRVGRNRQPFVCYKLRTMYKGTAEAPTHLASQSEITRFGRFARASKLDELPQLINVVLGHMSLVGPRPCLLTQDELIEQRQLRGVFELRPGITGLAQVQGIDMSDPERLAKVDAEYVRTRTTFMDLSIVFATVTGIIRKRPVENARSA